MVQLKLLSLLAASSSIAKAGTTPGACNPLKATSCSPDPALGTSIAEDFTKNSSWFPYVTGGGLVNYTNDGLSMTLDKRYDNPTLQSDFYIMYGKVEVELKAGPGRGVVSSFYLQSDDLDELDIEWVGSDNTQFQSNYFSKGNTTTYDRGQFHGVDSPVDKFHNYTLDWNVDKATWSLDNQVVRTLTNDSSEGYPQTPMFIKMGIWAGGDPDNAPGTIEWAGGKIDYSQAPFTMYVRRVVVTDYSSGKQYSYNGQSGSWESIEAQDGKVLGRTSQANDDYNTLNNGGSIASPTPRSTISPSSSSKSQSASQSSSHSQNVTSASDTKSSDSDSSTQSHSSVSKTSSSDQSSKSESRSTLEPTSTSMSKDHQSKSSGSEISSSVPASTQSPSGTMAGVSEVSSSSSQVVKTASNVAAAVGFSVNSLPFFAAVVALLL
ncbi:transglycosylase [Zygosaccharomyces mellis]|uniref:Crh-like protein n=1 Tax=Zygosaccharomyces mellis TaxID=42258 RepID=A0A4C2E345_9SACH|nr:transglycosylase [Zygosaccharomyces mellis]